MICNMVVGGGGGKITCVRKEKVFTSNGSRTMVIYIYETGKYYISFVSAGRSSTSNTRHTKTTSNVTVNYYPTGSGSGGTPITTSQGVYIGGNAGGDTAYAKVSAVSGSSIILAVSNSLYFGCCVLTDCSTPPGIL